MTGSDKLMPTVIFSILFIALTLLVVPQMVDVFYANASNANDSGAKAGGIGFTMIGGHQYKMWETTTSGTADNWSIAGNVTEWPDWQNKGLATDYSGTATNSHDMQLNSRVHFSFYEKEDVAHPERHRLDVWVVRNNTNYYGINPGTGYDGPKSLQSTNPFLRTNGMRDFVFFREYAWSGAWMDNKHNFYDVVSFSSLLNPINHIENLNLTHFSVMTKFNITFFEGSTNPNISLVNATYRNQFTIQVGSDLMNLMTRAHIGMWNIINDLFLFHSEELGMPAWLNIFISTILWVCVGFAAVGIISRFIPTIPGL